MPHIVEGLFDVEQGHDCRLRDRFRLVDGIRYSLELMNRRVASAEPKLLLRKYVVGLGLGQKPGVNKLFEKLAY